MFWPATKPATMIFRGRNFKFGKKSKIFDLRWRPKLLPHQKNFFRENRISTNLTAKKKFWGWGAHLGPAICLNVQKCGISWFLEVPIFHQNLTCGFCGCRSGPKFWGKKLEILGYIPKKNHQKIPKTRGATKTSKWTYFSGHGSSPFCSQ